MMRIDHIAIWVSQLEAMRDFYCKYFKLKSNDLYYNPNKQFSSYFLSAANGVRIELMHNPKINKAEGGNTLGWAHVAFMVGSRDEVDALTDRVRADGYIIVGEPRLTGDGYYESVIKDPEGNSIELTAG